jgi:hypothetical protein
MEAYKTPENWHTIEENGNLKYVFVNPATKRIERPYKTPKEYVAIMGIGNDRWLGGGRKSRRSSRARRNSKKQKRVRHTRRKQTRRHRHRHSRHRR